MKNVIRKVNFASILLLTIFALTMLAFSVGMITNNQPIVNVHADGEHTHDNITFAQWTETDSLPTSGDYYLTNDVTISSTLNVSGTLNLCLNGRGIKLNGSGSVIRVNGGATLNLFDCGTTVRYYYIGASSTYNSSCLGAIVESESDSKYVNAERRGSFVGGYITGGYGSSYSGSTVFGGGVLVDGGSFTMNGGCIFGNRLSVRDGGNGGGGVAVRKTSSSFVMNGGYIIGNHAGRFGGGIRIDGGTFVMNGGEIRHNTANTPNSGGAGCGGGLHLGGLDGGPTVTIAGGIIEGNYAGLKDGRGGGINVAGGTLTVTGGTITGNNATLSGGGINGSFTLKGDATISGNTVGGTFIADSYTLIGGTVNNVYLPTDNKITLASKINAETNIGVTLQSTTGTFTSGWSTHMEGKNLSGYFTSDNDNYAVAKGADGEAKLFEAAVSVTVGETESFYGDIESAIEAWKDGGTLTLFKDVNVGYNSFTVPNSVEAIISAILIRAEKTFTLDLNGHGIKMTGTGRVFAITGGATFNITDSSPTTEHYITLTNWRGTSVSDSGTESAVDGSGNGVVKVYGGYITGGNAVGGNANGWGGCLVVSLNRERATVNMSGGTIIGNTCQMSGAAMRAGAYQYGDTVFNMTGGAIIYNKAGQGGAVTWEPNAIVKISGGVIDNNFVGSNEVNVYLLDLDKDNQKITVDTAFTDVASIGVTMQNGTGTFTSGWSTYMKGKDPADYFVSDNADYLVRLKDDEAAVGAHEHDGITFKKWTTANALPTSAGSYYLAVDVTISSTWNVPAGTTNLCLCGHGIKKTGYDGAIKIGEGATLKLYDCDRKTEHRYSVSNPSSNGAGVATVNDALTSDYQTFTGGYITGGYITGGYRYGAGINLEGNGATLYMYGGTIIGNRLTASSTGGGGVCVQDWDKSGGFYMYGGSIVGNTSNYGGGVYVRCGKMEQFGGSIEKNVAKDNIGGGVLVFGGDSTLIVRGGVIGNNTAVHGGAIEASGGGTVTIAGGSFTDNSATGLGGALTNQRTDGDGSTANFNISGAPVFSGNTAGGSASDIYLCNTAVLNLTAEMTNTTAIGIKKASGTGTFTSGWSDNMEDADPFDYFTSDNGSYEIRLSDGEAYVGVHVHAWTYTVDGNVITATCAGVAKGTCDIADQTLTITASGKIYDGTAVVATLSFRDGWTVANGLEIPSIYYSDGVNAATTTAPVSVGTYTASITVGEKTATVEFEITRKTETKIDDKTGDEQNAVSVEGLDLELANIENKNPDANSISLVMTVEAKTEETAVNADSIIETAKNKSLEFFEVKIEKTIDNIPTVLDTTSNVLEIAVPYEKINKRGLIVYSYHGDSVRTFVESDTKEDGTFRVDKENRIVYIYANKFSTYAIGYTPYYRVQTSFSLGSYTGKANVTLESDADANITFTLENTDTGDIVFPDVPKGQYTLTIVWEDGITNTLKMKLTVGPQTVLSAITEKDAESEASEEQSEEQESKTYSAYSDPTNVSEILTEDAEIESVALVESSVIGKVQETNHEIGLIPRKREYIIRREYIF